MRKLSPALFAVAALSFLLPFASVSCNPASFALGGAAGGSGEVIVSGSDMALGTWPVELDIPRGAEGTRLPGPGPAPLALIAFAAAMGGVALAGSRDQRWIWEALAAVAGGVGAGSLLLLRSNLDLEIDELIGRGRWRYGWWVAVVALGLAAFVNLVLVIRSGLARNAPPEEPAPP